MQAVERVTRPAYPVGMPLFRPSRRFWFVAILIMIVGALGVGLAVRADRNDATPIVPYDPLPRW